MLKEQDKSGFDEEETEVGNNTADDLYNMKADAEECFDPSLAKMN
ncbi:unnamed protein product, partial [Rotaria sp. Silwood2]